MIRDCMNYSRVSDIARLVRRILVVVVVVQAVGMALSVTDARLGFEDLTFEVVSAFGTVGLSRGITGELPSAGQWVIMLVMFVGRTGPLTLSFLLTRPRQPVVRYPEGEVYIG